MKLVLSFCYSLQFLHLLRFWKAINVLIVCHYLYKIYDKVLRRRLQIITKNISYVYDRFDYII